MLARLTTSFSPVRWRPGLQIYVINFCTLSYFSWLIILLRFVFSFVPYLEYVFRDGPEVAGWFSTHHSHRKWSSWSLGPARTRYGILKKKQWVQCVYLQDPLVLWFLWHQWDQQHINTDFRHWIQWQQHYSGYVLKCTHLVCLAVYIQYWYQAAISYIYYYYYSCIIIVIIIIISYSIKSYMRGKCVF